MEIQLTLSHVHTSLDLSIATMGEMEAVQRTAVR